MRKIIIIAALVLYCVGVTFIILPPRFKEMKRVQKQVKEKEFILEKNQELIAHLEETSEKIDEHKEEIEKVEYAVPESSDPSYLLEFLHTVLPEAGLVFGEVKGISTSIVRKDENSTIEESRLGIRIAGKYEDFRTFLEKLEKSARLIEIEEITIFRSREEGEGGEGIAEEQEVLNYDISLSTYSQIFKQ